MDRTSGLGYLLDANGHRVFVNQNLSGGIDGTDVEQVWLTGVQEEILTVIEATRQMPDVSNNAQLFRGIGVIGRYSVLLTQPNGSITVPIPAGLAAGALIRTKITWCGGGGGGSSGLATQAGAGGGAGGFGWAYFDLLAGETYTYGCGLGGAGGLPGNAGDAPSAGLYGGRNGGVTWFKDPSGNTLFNALGGSTALTSSSGAAGGTGAAPPTVNGNIGSAFLTGGGAGGDGSVGSDLRGGDGAAGPWGGQGRAGDNTPSTSALAPANAYGAGGGGSYGPNPGIAGAGAPGMITLEY